MRDMGLLVIGVRESATTLPAVTVQTVAKGTLSWRYRRSNALKNGRAIGRIRDRRGRQEHGAKAGLAIEVVPPLLIELPKALDPARVRVARRRRRTDEEHPISRAKRAESVLKRSGDGCCPQRRLRVPPIHHLWVSDDPARIGVPQSAPEVVREQRYGFGLADEHERSGGNLGGDERGDRSGIALAVAGDAEPRRDPGERLRDQNRNDAERQDADPSGSGESVADYEDQRADTDREVTRRPRRLEVRQSPADGDRHRTDQDQRHHLVHVAVT